MGLPHTQRKEKCQTITWLVGQRHATEMFGTCTSKLGSKLLPSSFGL